MIQMVIVNSVSLNLDEYKALLALIYTTCVVFLIASAPSLWRPIRTISPALIQTLFLMDPWIVAILVMIALVITQSQIPLFLTLGIISLVSPDYIPIAMALLIIRTVNNYLLLLTSKMQVRAAKNPAIGALTLSLCVTNLLIRHKMIL